VPPPIEPNLLCFVDRADQQANPNGQELDFRQGHLDIPRDHEPFVEHTIEQIDQGG
jgi:hypothetical protein